MKRNKGFLKTGKVILNEKIGDLEDIKANYSGNQINSALVKLKEEGDDESIKSVDASTYYVKLFLEDLQKDLPDRMYVPKTIEKMVVDPAGIERPYFARMKGESIDLIELKEYYKLTILENRKIFGYDPWELHESRFDSYFKNLIYNYKYNIYKTLEYDASYEDQCNNFLKKLYDFYKPSFVTLNEIEYYSYDLFASLIKHQIWSVKNKLAIGEIDYPIFLNIEGEQGCGKSEFTRHMCRNVMKKMYAEVKTNMLNDGFAQTIWNKKLICNFEDLDKEDSVGNGKLKRLITAKESFDRGMRSEEFHETPNRATLFSNSNYAIWEIFPDKTGMRRYANLKFTRDDMKNDLLAQEYCDKIWDENLLALWKGVNEHEKMGYVFGNDMANLLDIARTTYVSSNDTVKKWLTKNDLKIVSNRSKGGKTLKEAYEDYALFTEENVTCNYSSFCKRVSSLYTGVVRLKPSKLKIVSVIEATNDVTVTKEEINPFTEYINFVPFGNDEAKFKNRQNVPHVPHVPPSFDQKSDEEKNTSLKESRGNNGNNGNISSQVNLQVVKINNVPTNPIERLIQDQKSKSQRWNCKIEYKEQPQKEEDFIEDNENFFKKLKEMKNE